MRLVEYMSERRGNDIPREHAIELVSRQYKEAYNAPVAIFRGVGGYGDYVYIDPSKSKQPRVSANTANYYTLIIDNSPKWKKYPKRSKSLICSTDESYANDFGNTYRVYPINGSNIGVCPHRDIWEAGHYKEYNFADIAGYINETIRTDAIKKDDADEDWETMNRVFKLVDKKKDKILEFMEKYYESYNSTMKFFRDYLDSGYTFMEYIEWILDPKLCGFQLVKTGMSIPGKREVWTDAPCVLVKVGTPDFDEIWYERL